MLKFIATAAMLSLFVGTAPGQDDFVEGQSRPEVVSIGRMPKPPVLDGNLDDWPADATGILLGSEKNCLRRHFNWTGTRDSSAVIRLAWDDEFLYLAADVCDDKLVQVMDDKEIYQGDSLELFFNKSPYQYRTDGFWQIAIAPPLKEGATLRVVGAQKPFEGVEGNAKVYPGGYTLECRIPWKNLTGFNPAQSQCLGFQMMLDDRDDKGRKSQQIWYPSAITFAQPTHMNTLRLAWRGDTSLPRVVAGPNNWCVSDPKKMPVSVLADVPGAKNAVISLRSSPQKPQTEPLLTLPLEAIGTRLTVAQGILTGIDDLDGLCDFGVTVTNDQGAVLATGNFQAELSARPIARIKELAAQLPKRLTALAQNPAVDPMLSQGLSLWMQRCNAFISNEGKPESTSRRLLDMLVEEMNALDAAVTRCEADANPYDGMTGSFIKAYTSPLTGKPRPLGLLIPKDYDAKADKRWPLIYLLHGIFADERQLSMMAWRLRDLGAIVCQAPAYRPLDWGGISAAESWTGLDEVTKQYKIDPDRVYLIGHAIGGRGVLQMAEGRPDLWAACAPLLTGADTGPKWEATRLYPQYFQQANDFHVTYGLYKPAEPPKPLTSPVEKKLLEQASLASRVENLISMPLRHSYGEENPNTASERLAILDRFIELGAPLATHEVPGAAHGSQPDEWQSPDFYQWLLSHRRPPVPTHIRYTVNGLRYNEAWWVRADQLSSPADLGRIDAALDGIKIEVKTRGLAAFTLLPKSEPAQEWTVAIDGQPALKTKASKDAELSFVRNAEGRWKSGSLKSPGKRHGVSGPIDDFQFGRFLVVYGTQGDEKANALLTKMGKKLSDWGLGSVFDSKADRDVTPEDMQQSHLLLIGTPKNNAVLAKMQEKLPMKWTEDGCSMGSVVVSGSGAGACFIQPNPLAPERYIVVVTANDEEGYGVWTARGPSDDYLFGNASQTAEGKPSFTTTTHGCFDNQWHWTKEGCAAP